MVIALKDDILSKLLLC